MYAFSADTVVFNHNFVPLELAGALLITVFNIFTIVYKMYFAPEGGDDDTSESSECEYGVLDIRQDEFNELDEDSIHNLSTEEDSMLGSK